MVRAVVLAAGASSRMGRSKAGLPLTDRADTFLNRILRTLLAAGLPDIVVVTGCAAEETTSAAGRMRAPVRFAHNPNWTSGQLSSLLVGLADRPGNRLEAALVSLVDAPLFSSDTVRRVTQAWRQSGASIVRPAAGEVHGHPVVFDACLFAELRATNLETGAKAVVRAHTTEILNVPVTDAGAFIDIDTPQAYSDALRALAGEGA